MEDDMLRTTIQTTDKEGKELPIPAEFLEKVQRAADVLATMLREVGEKFEIDIHWRFERMAGKELAVGVSIVAHNVQEPGTKSVTWTLSKDDLASDASIRRTLWSAINLLIPILSKEVDRMLARIRHDLAVLATTAEE
jgi:hypothetical protein